MIRCITVRHSIPFHSMHTSGVSLLATHLPMLANIKRGRVSVRVRGRGSVSVRVGLGAVLGLGLVLGVGLG